MRKKRFFAVVLSLVMLCSIIPSIATMVSASTGGHSRAEAVAWANSKIGSALDYDGYYGAQCVDLIYYYYVYLGQSAPGGHARDFANGGKYTPSGWSYQSSPQPGDIAVDSSGFPGHVGIVTKIEGSYMYCVEQNYNYQQYCQEVRRNLYSHGYSTFIRPDFVTTVTCTVTFNPNGGKVSPTSKTVTVGQPYGTLPTPTRSGYVFLGWGASTSATTYYTSSTVVSNSSNHTLYAIWAKALSVKFDAQGGSVSQTGKTVYYGGKYGTLPTPTRKDYAFLGWSNNINGTIYVTADTKVTKNNDHTLYAIWKGPGEWSAWSSWSATSVSPSSTREVETKSEVTSYNMITYCCGNSSGYRCYLPYLQSGYTLRAGPYEETWSASTMKSSTAYAPGAYFDYYDGTAVDGYIIGPGNAYVAADGYTPFYIASKNTRTLYRYRDWKDYVYYTVSFDSNGGSSVPIVQVKSGGNVSSIPSSTRSGYSFKGWFTKKTGGEKLTTSTVISSNVTYYAHWESSCDILGHSFGAWQLKTAATCTSKGTEERVCSRCGNTETRDIPALGHSFGSDGNAAKCSVCGAPNPNYDPSLDFKDVPANAPYAEAVAWAVANDVASGTSATTFSPNEGCTRGQVVSFLWRAAGAPEPDMTRNPFSDVKPGAYYYKPVMWAVENHVTSGTSATTFSPNSVCTRAQIVTFLWNAKGMPTPTASSNPFKDVKSTDYFYNAVMWAVGKGVTAGTDSTHFSPNVTCTRWQVVTFIFRDRTK